MVAAQSVCVLLASHATNIDVLVIVLCHVSSSYILSSYHDQLRYKAGKDNANADACSRVPIQETVLEPDTLPETVHLIQSIQSSK